MDPTFGYALAATEANTGAFDPKRGPFFIERRPGLWVVDLQPTPDNLSPGRFEFSADGDFGGAQGVGHL